MRINEFQSSTLVQSNSVLYVNTVKQCNYNSFALRSVYFATAFAIFNRNALVIEPYIFKNTVDVHLQVFSNRK